MKILTVIFTIFFTTSFFGPNSRISSEHCFCMA